MVDDHRGGRERPTGAPESGVEGGHSRREGVGGQVPSGVEIQRALEAGARGYLLKSMPPSDLLDVIRQVHAGKKRIPPEVASQLAEHMGDELLTQREIDVLRAVADGNRNRDIAEKLFISEETVKVHIKHIMEKLHASDRTDAVAIGVRRGIIHL